MPGILLDGKTLSKQLEQELLQRVKKIKEKNGNKSPILEKDVDIFLMFSDENMSKS